MNNTEIVKSIAYCGLVCKLCHLSGNCAGCKSDFGCEEWKDCVHRRCCIEKNINGCWECDESPCDKKMFANGHDLRIRAFIKFMKEESPERLIECIVRNETKGIKYGYQKDYDLKNSEEEIINILLEGKLSTEKKVNPYEECPTYETKQFIFRLVEETDSEDLLQCYSDPESARLFNSDNCTSDFIFKSFDEVKNCIKLWLQHYREKYYVRFSIMDKLNERAIGTIEFFAKPVAFDEITKVGLLRLDLVSKYEKEESIIEMLETILHNFYDVFEVEHIITKAIPEAEERIAALKNKGFIELENMKMIPFDFYFIRAK